MRGVFDFGCPNGHVTEDFINVEVEHIQCPKCSEKAEKMVSAPRLLRIDGRPANMLEDSWAKAREKNYKRNYDNTGGE